MLIMGTQSLMELWMKLIHYWFNTMNAKTTFYGQQARDERRDPIRRNRTESIIYLQNFCNWLKQWKNTAGMRGLSDQTFEPAIQTAQTFPPMITYLFDTKNLDYVLTSHIQADYLESRFGWYHQLCGANYYNSVLIEMLNRYWM